MTAVKSAPIKKGMQQKRIFRGYRINCQKKLGFRPKLLQGAILTQVAFTFFKSAQKYGFF